MNHFYQDIPGWFAYEDVYMSAVKNAEDGAHFVEVGSWKGKSTAFMAVEIANSGKNIKFDAIDTWNGSDELKKDSDVVSGKLFEVFKKNIEPAKEYCNPVRMESVKASSLYADNSLDFIFIDASHDYENVKKDIQAWLPKLKKEGMIAGDDYEKKEFPGVFSAVREIFGDKVAVSGKSWIVDRRMVYEKPRYDVILRTHSGSNVHSGTRFVDATKTEIIFRCLFSLVKSVNESSEDIRLLIIDDHSSEACVAGIKKILNKCKYPTEFIHLNEHGNGASLKACYEYARDFGRDIIYFVEDDYLHFSSAVTEMISAGEQFKKNLGGTEVAIHPVDDPKDYVPKVIFPTRIVCGENRHWRTNIYTTGTFLISRKIILRNWDKFMEFTKYGAPGVTEDTTINHIWRNGEVTLFTPVPSLALHMQFPEDKSPFVDWRKLWDENEAL